MLTALTANGPARRPGGLWERVHTTLHALCEGRGLEFWGPLDAASRYWEADDDQLSISLTDLQRLAGLVKLLAEFGMASGGVSRPVVTPLGRWALERLREGLAGPAGPSLTASELIAEAVPVRGCPATFPVSMKGSVRVAGGVYRGDSAGSPDAGGWTASPWP
jgi:hypothetical protein